MYLERMRDSSKEAQAARLREARELRYESVREAAEALGVPEQTWYSWESGANGFSHRAPWLAERLGVNLEWLLTNIGPKRRGEREPLETRISRLPADRQRELLDLIEFWESRNR